MQKTTRLICTALLISWTSICSASEAIVFQSFPSTVDGKAMKKDEQAKSGILIKKKDGVYVWASRQDKKLSYTQSGIYHVFSAEDGSGIISIEDATALSPSFRPGSTPIRYGEHIRSGIGVISYIGTGNFLDSCRVELRCNLVT